MLWSVAVSYVTHVEKSKKKSRYRGYKWLHMIKELSTMRASRSHSSLKNCAATMAIQLLSPMGSTFSTTCSCRFSLSTNQDSARLHFTCSSRNVSPLGRVSWCLLHTANSQTTNSDSGSVNTKLPTTPDENERQSETDGEGNRGNTDRD